MIDCLVISKGDLFSYLWGLPRVSAVTRDVGEYEGGVGVVFVCKVLECI